VSAQRKYQQRGPVHHLVRRTRANHFSSPSSKAHLKQGVGIELTLPIPQTARERLASKDFMAELDLWTGANIISLLQSAQGAKQKELDQAVRIS
jgi:hypothetical protein